MSLYSSIDRRLAGSHTVTSADVTAGQFVITVGLPFRMVLTQHLRSDALFWGDFQVTEEPPEKFTVADGATDALIAGEVVHWIAIQ